MTDQRMLLDITDGVAHLRLARPEARNAMDPAFVSAATETLDAVEADGSVRALLVTGDGPSFCVGGDMKYFAVHSGTAGGGLGFVWCADSAIAAENTTIATGFADLVLSGDGGVCGEAGSRIY